MIAEDMTIDYLEAGEGHPVILVHSSVSGARQWRKLMEILAPSFRVMATNLIGYGKTPAWTSPNGQVLDDQAALIEELIATIDGPVSLVGHSFGGTVAMKVAHRLGQRIKSLVLLEPNPVFLLRDNGRPDAFAEAWSIRDIIKSNGAKDDWMTAAALFADYWGGAGTWAATPVDRRETFAQALRPNFHEWDAVMSETIGLHTLAETLPLDTLVVYDPQTVRPIREVVELLHGATAWQFEAIAKGGHMAPLTHPEIVNPIVERHLLSASEH